MLIGRCAWHRRYFGRFYWSGVASWRGLAIRFTDGICERCLERFRDENRPFFDYKRVPDRAPSSDSPASVA